MKREHIEREFPHAVTLRFRSIEERNVFMGQLSDGWGENKCALEWDARRKFESNDVFGVEVAEEDLLAHRESEERTRRRETA